MFKNLPRSLCVLTAVFALMVLATGTVQADLFSSNGFHTYFNNPPNGDDFPGAVVDLIDSAESSVDVAIFSLNQPDIVNALVNAHDRGVDVRVVTEDENRNKSKFESSYDKLENNGITVKTDDRSSALMHHKFVIVDDVEVLSGSYNFTKDQTTEDKNNAVIIHSSGVASDYSNEFNDMWNGDFGASKGNNGNVRQVDGHKVYIDFAPNDNMSSTFQYHLGTADVSVYFNIFTFTDGDIANEMIDLAVNDDVKIQGVFDAWQNNSQYSEYCTLKTHSSPLIEVTEDAYNGLLHDKFAVIDGGASEDKTPKTITGSYNWTSSADDDNDENMLTIYDPDVADSYKGVAVYVQTYKDQNESC